MSFIARDSHGQEHCLAAKMCCRTIQQSITRLHASCLKQLQLKHLRVFPHELAQVISWKQPRRIRNVALHEDFTIINFLIDNQIVKPEVRDEPGPSCLSKSSHVNLHIMLTELCCMGFVQHVELLRDRGASLLQVQSGLREALCHGHLDMVKYLVGHGLQLPIDSTLLACQSGDLPCLRYVRETGCMDWSSGDAALASKRKYFACLNYAIDNGASWKNVGCNWRSYSKLIDHWVHNWVRSMFNQTLRRRWAAEFIQSQWRSTSCDPRYALCRRRLMHEYVKDLRSDFGIQNTSVYT